MGLAYDGTYYGGMAEQVNVTTVMSKIKEALGSLGYNKKRLWFMSRTDRGVHALFQILSLDVDRSFSVNAFDSLLPESLIVHSYAWVNFRQIRKRITKKTYLYIAPNFRENYSKLIEICELISSDYWDFKSLSKRSKLAVGKTEMRLKVNCDLREDFQFFYVSGKYFLWEQVRRLITLMKMYGLGKIKYDELVSVLQGNQFKRGIPPAPAEGLILWDVDIDVNWKHRVDLRILRRIFLEKVKRLAILFASKWVL